MDTEYLAICFLSCRYNIDLASIDVLIISDSVMPNCITEIRALIPNARIIQIGHYKSHFGNIFALNKNLNNVNSVLLALDGFGDGFSGASGYSSGSTFDISKFYSSTNSLGLLYTAATQHIGLGGFGSEGKLQGLAPYGEYKEEYSIAKFINLSSSDYSIDSQLSSKDGLQIRTYAVQYQHNPYFK